ncbi:MAG TPA: sigma-70 family RNA polymerase sigma factor [Vicinamibacterales bacterium]|nr:sigma-70 family RNA polymerase sigma factor [Vicinamibacterales bacterium]
MDSAGDRRDQSERRLIRRAATGDQSAADALWRRHLPLLRRWAHGRLPRWARRFADTGDIVQEALIRTFRRLDRFEPRGNGALEAYLRQAVRNRIRDEIRRAQRQPAEQAVDSDHTTLAPSPFELASESEERARYRAALIRLGEADRELVVARLELHYSYEQIALISQRVTANAARVAVRRAILRLAQEMDVA